MARTLKLILAVALLMGIAAPAWAHNFVVTGDCKGWYLDLDGKWDAVGVKVGNTPIPLDQIDGPGGNTFFVADNVASRLNRSFTVTWDKAQGPDVVVTHQGSRTTAGCVDFDVVAECGIVSAANFRNDTAISYAVAFEEGAATYDLANATFGSRAFTEDHNGGTVSVSYYLVGGEADFITGTQTDLPNFWEQSAASIELDTDCEEPATTTTVAEATTTVPDVTTTVPDVTTTVPDETSSTVMQGPSFSDDEGFRCHQPDGNDLIFDTPEEAMQACQEIEQIPALVTTEPLTELPFTGIEDGLVPFGGAAILAGLGLLVANSLRGRRDTE